MWMYSGTEDTTRIHPEEVEDDMLEGWLTGITGNRDNPRGARRVPPFDQSHEPDKVRLRASDYDLDSLMWLFMLPRLTFILPAFFQALTDMYSMPNGEQEQDPEG